MKLTSITVENFRCFEKLTLDLHPELTVLIAPNGAGKTTMLDAARIAVWPFVKAFDLGGQVGKSATIQTEDVRMVSHPKSIMEPVIPSKVIATGIWDDNKSEKKWMKSGMPGFIEAIGKNGLIMMRRAHPLEKVDRIF